ncbi:MAG: hypothetical protein M1833_000487 [Piccolia ochrophora]|nr:MAG: hypothetical protein M1833_000487 [Piccolia ochrophora]
MVKADSTRDYYADLEIPKGADVVEIKKQFKKLALKYHPDRNPGHEEEFSPRFQAIQAAHEVLTDPAQRAKYDADRAKLGFRYGATAPRPNTSSNSRNPYAAYSDFPPPPKPPPPRNSSATGRPGYSSTPSSGASRYAKFAKSFETSGSREETNAKTNAFKAWENIKASQNSANPPRAPRRNDASWESGPNASHGTPPQPPPRPRPTSEFIPDPKGPPPQMHRSHTTRMPKKSGFAPATPGGDEPAAPSASSYFNMSGSGRPNPPRFQTSATQSSQPPPPPPPPPPPATQGMSRANKPDTLGHFKTQNQDFLGPNSARLRTPYASAGGEKTSIFPQGPALGRSATVREPAKHSTPERHRSASPPRRRDYKQHRNGPNTGSRTGPSSPIGVSPERIRTDPGGAPVQQRGRPRTQRARFEPFVESETSSEGQTSSSVDGSPSFAEQLAAEGRARAKKKGQSRKYPSYESMSQRPQNPVNPSIKINVSEGPPKHSQGQWRSGSSSSERPGAHEKPSGQASKVGIGERVASTYASSIHPSTFATSGLYTSQPKSEAPVISILDLSLPNAPAEAADSAASHSGLLFEWRPEKYLADNASTSSFTFPVDDDTFVTTPPPAAELRPGSQKINTRFSPSDWKGQFASNGADYFGTHAQRDDARRSSQAAPSPSRGRSANIRQPANVEDGPPVVPGLNHPDQAASPVQTKFSPEYWAQTFKQQSWDPSLHPPPPRKRSESRLKGTRPKGVAKRQTAPKPAGVGQTLGSSDEETAASDAFSGESLGTKASRESGPMDIDSGIAPPVGGSMNGRVQTPPLSTGAQHATTAPQFRRDNTFSPETTPNLAHLHAKGPSSPPLGGSSGRRPSEQVEMSSLNNVEPLTSSRTGLHDMKDISSSLPFASRASAAHPAKTFSPQRLELPQPPRPPPAPAKITQGSWEQYLAPMRKYMGEWSQFIDKMNAHCEGRQREVKGLSNNWLGALGEGERGGYLTYMQGVEEDFRVREHCNVAWEKHRNAMWAFGKVREAAVEKALGSA